MGGRLALLAFVLAPMASALAQEPMTILAQKQWSASGVCVGLHQCGFCWASASVAPGVTLRVDPPRRVAVQLPDQDLAGHGNSVATLEIGGESFALTLREEDFAASEADAIRIIQAMRRTVSLTLRIAGKPYRADLNEFAAAYGAILKSCPGAAAP